MSRPTMGHVTADALARVYAAAYPQARISRDGDSLCGPEAARLGAEQACDHFIALVDAYRGDAERFVTTAADA